MVAVMQETSSVVVDDKESLVPPVPSTETSNGANNGTVQEKTSERDSTSQEKGNDKTVFPPPCNWYKNSVAAARDDMWAYCADRSIVLVHPPTNSETISQEVATPVASKNGTEVNLAAIPDLKAKTSKRTSGRWPTFSLIATQIEKYNAISFCQNSWDYLPIPGSPLVSGCERGIVRVWNLENNSTVIYHDNHLGSQVTGVDWSPYDHSIIYAMDDKGTMSVWNVVKNRLRSMNFGKISPTCVRASPHEKNVVCFGTKGGNVFVVDVTDTTGKILAKVRHEEEVVLTSWVPKGEWDVLKCFGSDEKSNSPVLVSTTHSMKLPTLRLWNKVGYDVGTLQSWEKDTKVRSFKMFGCGGWAKDPNSGKLMLLSSGRHGEILAWTNGLVHDTLHFTHTHNAIFSMVQCGDILWSLSYEPIIVGFNLRTMEVECVLPTFKGVCTIAPSPIDSSRLAIGGTDSVIRVLKCLPGYPTEQDSSTKSPVVTHKLKGKVTAMTWHPTRDNFIGFGTDEGVLGYFELKEKNRLATTFERRVKGTVYTVGFGPSVYSEGYVQPPRSGNNENEGEKLNVDCDKDKSKEKDSLMLYACGGNSCFMINPSRSSNSLIHVGKIIEKSNPPSKDLANFRSGQDQATDFRWAPDYSYLAVGYNDGRIDLYTPPNLKLKIWIKCHLRAIQYLIWRPFDFCADKDSGTRWLASASNDGTTRLYNLATAFEEQARETESQEPLMIISSEATLQGHGVRVISCAWSPHNKNLLVTVAYDCTAIVWNLEDGSHVARYMDHKNRLVACCFHPTDEFKVISGSDDHSSDFTLHVWDYREHPFRRSGPKVPGCKPVRAIKAANEDNGSIQETPAQEVVSITDHGSGSIHAVKATGDRNKAKPKPKSLLPLTSNALINTKCAITQELKWIIDKTPFTLPSSTDVVTEADNPSVYLGVLGGAEECRKLANVEKQSHVSKKQLDHAATLSAWIGDKECLEQAIKNRQVTETMLHIAKLLSKALYIEAVTVFAEQLIENEEYARASTMFFVIGNFDRAVKVLVDQALYREALTLLKITLPKEDYRIADVTNKWAQRAITDGNFELACKIYCSTGQFSNAISVIEKRAMPFAYNAGCYISSKQGDERKLEMFGVKFILDGIVRGVYQECHTLILEYPALMWLETIVKTHEFVTGYTKYIAGIKTSRDFDMWKMVLVNSLDTVKDHLFGINLEQSISDQKKISRNILVSIAQNESDAHQIITKNLALLLMGINDEEEQAATIKGLEIIKLATVWFEKKNFPLYCAIVLSTWYILIEFKFSKVEEYGTKIPAKMAEAKDNAISLLQTLLKTEDEALSDIVTNNDCDTEEMQPNN